MNPTSGPRVVRRSRGERRTTYLLKVLATVALGAVVVAAIFAFFMRVPTVTVVLVGATFFTYAIYPLVRRLNARVPLVLAIVIVYAAIAAVAAIFAFAIVPALASDLQSLGAALPEIVRNAQSFVTNPHNPILRRLPPPIRSYLVGLPPQAAHLAQTYAGDAASRTFAIVLSAVSLVATAVVIPVVSVYLMIEAPDLIDGLVARLPQRLQPKATAIVRDLDAALGGFIRGQLLVGATIGACIVIALLILHVRYAVLIGVTAGLLDVIPYVGAFVGFVPAVALALLDDGWQHALVVAVVFLAIFQAEGHFIAPKIVSDSVGLSPLMVIVAILIGGELLGIGGMFLAVPVAAVVRVLAIHALPPRRRVASVPPVATVDDTTGVPGERDVRSPAAAPRRARS